MKMAELKELLGYPAMATQELEHQLMSLSPDEQLATIRVLLKAVEEPARGITKTPGVMGGDACIATTQYGSW